MGNTQISSRKLRQAIDENDQSAVQRLLQKGADINKAIDEMGNTPLTLAIQLNHSDIVKCLLKAKCDVEKKCRQQFSGLEIVLLHLAHTEDETYLEILGVLLQAGAETISEVVIETTFQLLQGNQKLLMNLVTIVATHAPAHHEVIGLLSHMMVQYNRTDCFWLLLENGTDLQFMWPCTCDKRYFLTGDAEFNTSINGTMSSTVCYSVNPEFAKMVIQAANNKSVLSSVIYFLLVYPLNAITEQAIQELLQHLALAGYRMSPFLLSHLSRVHKNAVHWYKDFQSQPLSLMQTSRLCIRHAMNKNVIHGVKSLSLPPQLKSYLTIEYL